MTRLSHAFSANPTPTTREITLIADSMGVTPRNVRVWYQNRRQRGCGSLRAQSLILAAFFMNFSSASPDDAADAALETMHCGNPEEIQSRVTFAWQCLIASEAMHHLKEKGISEVEAVLCAWDGIKKTLGVTALDAGIVNM